MPGYPAKSGLDRGVKQGFTETGWSREDMRDVKTILFSLSALLVAAGLLVMVGMLVWSFHLAKDFSGRYETAGFHRHFWSLFFFSAGLCLLGCLGISRPMKPRAAAHGGIATLVLGLVLLIALVPVVDFEGWTGAAAYMLAMVIFSSSALFFAAAVIKWLWLEFRTRQSAAR
jgi:hypothetical protein